MEEPAPLSQNPLLLEDDLFPESLITDFSPVFLDESVPHSQDLQQVSAETDSDPCLDDLQSLLATETEAIKSEPEPEDYFGSFYPEVTLNEGPGMQAQAKTLKEENVISVAGDSETSAASLKTLIDQLNEQMTPAEVCRSVNCFVPVIRLQNADGIKRVRCLRRTPLMSWIKSRRLKRRIEKFRNGKLKSSSGYRTVLAPEEFSKKQRGRGRPRKNGLPFMPTVKDEGNMSCNICFREFRTGRAFQSHQKRIDTPGDTKCMTCNLDLKHPNCLRYHRRKLHGEVEEHSEDIVATESECSRVCEICNKIFTRVAGLVYHRRRCHNMGISLERNYSCTKCNKSFLRRSHLVSHRRGHQLKAQLGEESDHDSDCEKKKFPKCDICGKKFTRVTGLLYHKRQVHRIGKSVERKFHCTTCEKTFLKRSHLVLHSQSHTGERLFPCRFCERSFGGTTGRRFHEEKVHGVNAKCLSQEEILQKREEVAALKQDSSTDALATTDSATKHNDGPRRSYPCAYCTKVFIRPSAKRIHERIHTGEKPFLCMVCGNTYKSSVALKEHEKTAHTHTLDLLCTICGAAFGRQMSLKYHILSRHNDKKYICDNDGCGRSFVQLAKLVRHQKIHKLGLYQCKTCNRTLESTELLERHMQIHEMRKIKVDGEEGNVPRYLGYPRKKPPPKQRRQRKTPAPIRKLQCSYCDKRFPYQNELDKHTKAIHLNEREFKCLEKGCSRAYISHYKLQNHLRQAHGHIIENNLLADVECDICGKVVQGAARLAIHKNSRHSDTNSKSLSTKYIVPVTAKKSSPTKRGSKDSIDVVGISNSISEIPPTENSVDPPTPVISSATISYHSQRGIQVQPAQLPRHSNSSIPQGSGNTIVQNDLRQTAFGQAHEHFPYLNFPPVYTSTFQPPSFPYTSTTLIHQDFQSAPSFWQTQQTPSNVSRHTSAYHAGMTSTTASVHSRVEQVRDDYASSDYSDLIRIPAQDTVDDQQNEDCSTNNDGGDGAPEADNPDFDEQDENQDNHPVRKRGRPRKTVTDNSTCVVLKGPVPGQERRRAAVMKPRKPLAKKQLPCPVCNKVFGTNQHLRTHQQTHERKERESTEECKCDICGKTFTRPYYLTVHSVIHDPTIKPFKCNEAGCHEAFRAPAEFRKHKSVHSIKTERRYRCKICKEEKQTSGELHSHVIALHADKMYACTHPGCAFICPTPSRLKRHGEQHQDKGERLRPYKCPLCECSYIRGENLQQHLDTSHDGASTAVTNPDVSAFTCHICSKQFEFDWKVKSHIRKTHGKKSQDSSNGFPKNRPLFYYCEDCDWSFPDAGTLRRHMKTRHKGESIKCLRQSCDKKYFYVNTLENHVRTQHENISPEEEEKLIELRQQYPSEPEVNQKSQRRGRRSKTEVLVHQDPEYDFLDSEHSEFEPKISLKKDIENSFYRKRRLYHSDSETSEEDSY